MSISLEKRSEKVKIQLAKRNIRDKVILRVGAALDKSGSAEPFYKNGQMQELVDRLLAVAHNFDDNGEIDMWAFHNHSMELEPATPASYGGYVNNVIMKGRYKNSWGGTEYAPPMKDIINHYFPTEVKSQPQPKEEKKGLFGRLFGGSEEPKAVEPAPVDPASDIPALILFVTDGANSDQGATERLLEQSKDKPVYWLMVGIGNPEYFEFIERMGEKFNHVGFVNFDNLDLDDDDMYDQILSEELAEWIKKHSK